MCGAHELVVAPAADVAEMLPVYRVVAHPEEPPEQEAFLAGSGLLIPLVLSLLLHVLVLAFILPRPTAATVKPHETPPEQYRIVLNLSHHASIARASPTPGQPGAAPPGILSVDPPPSTTSGRSPEAPRKPMADPAPVAAGRSGAATSQSSAPREADLQEEPVARLPDIAAAVSDMIRQEEERGGANPCEIRQRFSKLFDCGDDSGRAYEALDRNRTYDYFSASIDRSRSRNTIGLIAARSEEIAAQLEASGVDAGLSERLIQGLRTAEEDLLSTGNSKLEALTDQQLVNDRTYRIMKRVFAEPGW